MLQKNLYFGKPILQGIQNALACCAPIAQRSKNRALPTRDRIAADVSVIGGATRERGISDSSGACS